MGEFERLLDENWDLRLRLQSLIRHYQWLLDNSASLKNGNKLNRQRSADFSKLTAGNLQPGFSKSNSPSNLPFSNSNGNSFNLQSNINTNGSMNGSLSNGIHSFGNNLLNLPSINGHSISPDSMQNGPEHAIAIKLNAMETELTEARNNFDESKKTIENLRLQIDDLERKCSELTSQNFRLAAKV